MPTILLQDPENIDFSDIENKYAQYFPLIPHSEDFQVRSKAR